MDFFADIILFDTVGIEYDGSTYRTKGMGGSEFQAILLLEELSKKGYKTICLNNSKKETQINNVLYLPNIYIKKYKFKCNNLIIHRNSEIPNIFFKKAFLWATDLNSTASLRYIKYFKNKQISLITLSNYQYNLYPTNWEKQIINFIIPDFVYSYKQAQPKLNNNYIYSSSMMKGYNSTLEVWKYLKDNDILQESDTLNVCLPGYDNPNYNLSNKEYNINYFKSLNFNQVVELTNSCIGLFYVNTLPETFGISIVLADILNTTPYVCGISDLGALPEFINNKYLTTDIEQFINYFKVPNTYQPKRKDFTSNTIIKEWEKILFKA